VANDTAESKPNVIAVRSRSLSIVFGTPTTRTPRFASSYAIASEPSPPTVTSASKPCSFNFATSSSPRSHSTVEPSGCMTGKRNGSPWFVVPRIVPPRCAMPETRSRVSRMTPSPP
jgi:hypothetical protein